MVPSDFDYPKGTEYLCIEWYEGLIELLESTGFNSRGIAEYFPEDANYVSLCISDEQFETDLYITSGNVEEYGDHHDITKQFMARYGGSILMFRALKEY